MAAMKSQVSIVRCPEYELPAVEAAVRQACDAAGFPEVAGKTVLFKPNILRGAEPERAVSTHPTVLRAAIRYAKSRGAAKVLVGESPSFQVGNAAFKKSGLLDAAAEEGAEWVDFSDGVQVDNPEGKLVKNFTIARAAVDADVLVSLCKLKNHRLMYYTGAMKNLFGCVPGLQKSQFHLRFPERASFGRMLTDLNLALRCEFSLMDAVVGMEGPGPSAGTPRQVGAILASRDPVALDRSACRIIGLDPRLVVNLEDALGRGVWIGSDDDIEILGTRPEEFRIDDWKMVPRDSTSRREMPSVMRNLVVGRPFFSRNKCIACGACVTICPGKALDLVPDPKAKAKRRIEVDYTKCIRCYCCHEVCPEDAIVVRRIRPLGAQWRVRA
jgi:uncharacterized protein (DUF362 family)/NAD-dependent dihydropyrimidine dehydrogenase PreA subunit